MAFSHGAIAKLYANGYELSEFLQNVNINGNLEQSDVTCIGQTTTPFYKAWLAGPIEGVLTADGFFDGDSNVYDPTANPPHPGIDKILDAALGLTAGSVLSYLPYGDGFGYYGYGMNAEEARYDIVKVVDQVVKVNAEFRSSTGLERAVILEADGTVRTGDSAGVAIDQGASSLLGASAFLQTRVMGSAFEEVIVQHSTNNVDWVDLIAFPSAVSEPQAQYKIVTGTVNRYVRASWLHAVGIVFHLMFCRKS